MDSYLYLIRNGDLYKIGSCGNLDKEQEILKPGELYSYLKTKEAANICKKMYVRYSDVRLPSSDYFRLSKSQLLECKLMMKSNGNKDYFQPIFKGKVMVVTFIFSWILISYLLITLAIEPVFNSIF